MNTDLRLRSSVTSSVFIIFFLSFLAACAGQGVQPTPYLPPTPVRTQTPGSFQALPLSTAIQPAPSCTDNLYYIQDLTIPDGSLVLPGSRLDKQWLIQNNGTCNWNENYRLRLISGDALGAPIEQALYPARSGTQMVIRILFTAPMEPGTYRSAWQAYNPQGSPFGDPVFIEIAVSP